MPTTGSVTIQVTGIAELQKALNGDLRKAIRTITFAGAQQAKGFISPYPPASEANAPDHRWYQRGYGPRWKRKDKSIGGRKTSEMLNRSWGSKHVGQGAEVGSRASYVAVVHDAQEQASFHASRHWVTNEQAAEKLRTSGAMDLIVNQAIKHAMGGK